MKNRTWLGIAALVLALGVGLGAFGAHRLKDVLTDNDMKTYQTAVFYQLLHGLGLALIQIVPAEYFSTKARRLVSIFFFAGIAIFSGSLYGLVLSGHRWLGAVTPIGGLLFISGWVALACSCFTKPKSVF